MFFVLVGVALLVLKLVHIDPVAGWSWLWVLLPFGLALAWWQVSDSVGLTRRREMDKMDARKEERRRKSMEALGLNTRQGSRVKVFKDSRKREAERIEAEREAKRKQQKEAVSGFGAMHKPATGHATDDTTRLE
jgi:small Trp-rich protein